MGVGSWWDGGMEEGGEKILLLWGVDVGFVIQIIARVLDLRFGLLFKILGSSGQEAGVCWGQVAFILLAVNSMCFPRRS